MIACLDVHYAETSALAAGVILRDWTSSKALAEAVHAISSVASYQPGEFYRRELPCLLQLITTQREFLQNDVRVFIVDGYVHLGADRRDGLGAYLHRAIGNRTVVGVAKTQFAETTAVEVRRGGSVAPLYVTAIGMDEATAAENVRRMYGQHRVPAALRRVDRLSRGDAPRPYWIHGHPLDDVARVHGVEERE
jgi:deoxyribonuclease V